MASSIEYCYSKNNNNMDRFSDCVVEKSKKVDDIMKSFEYKFLFISKSASSCLNSGKSVSECVD
jgi:hypothetical protein